MSVSTENVAPGPLDPGLVGDHLALDLINTQAMNGAVLHDFWQTDSDVLRWLKRFGIECGDLEAETRTPSLLERARRLRETASELVGLRKRGLRGNPARLNEFLTALQSAPVLSWTDDVPHLVRHTGKASPARALGTVAEAVATLLAEGNFELVRQCEHPDCVLWFYDRTKSHRRRWCSMATCGNRHKAAEFRKRNAATAS